MSEVVKEEIKEEIKKFAPGQFIRTKIDMVKQKADQINTTLTTAADDAFQSFQFLGRTYVLIQIASTYYLARQLNHVSHSLKDIDQTLQRSGELTDFIERMNGFYFDHMQDKVFVMVQSSSLRDRIRGRLNRTTNNENRILFETPVSKWLDKHHIYHPKQAQTMFNDALHWKEAHSEENTPIVFYFYGYKQESYDFTDTITVPAELGTIRFRGDYDRGEATIRILSTLQFSQGESNREIVFDGIAECKVAVTGGQPVFRGNNLHWQHHLQETHLFRFLSKTVSYLLYRIFPGSNVLVKDFAEQYLPLPRLWYTYMHIPGTFSCLGHLYHDLFQAVDESKKIKAWKYAGYVTLTVLSAQLSEWLWFGGGLLRVVAPEMGYYLGHYVGKYFEEKKKEQQKKEQLLIDTTKH